METNKKNWVGWDKKILKGITAFGVESCLKREKIIEKKVQKKS